MRRLLHVACGLAAASVAAAATAAAVVGPSPWHSAGGSVPLPVSPAAVSPAAASPTAVSPTPGPAAPGAPAPTAVAAAPATRGAAALRPAQRVVRPVAPLRALRQPAAFVQLPTTLTAGQLAAVRAMPAVDAVAVVDTGRLQVDGRLHPALGVSPSGFRAFTPEPSARSDGLWQVVARGELAAAYGDDAPAHALLGRRVPVGGNGTRPVRLGAFAAFGLQQADVVVDISRGRQLGLAPRTGLVVAAGQVEATALRSRLAALTGGEVTLLGAAAAAGDTVRPSQGGRAQSWRELYMQAAATCPGLSWTVLAAIGQVESGHGRNNGPSSAGAIGPMQFLPSTFALYAVDGDHDGRVDAWDAYDAVPAAARLLCSHGAGLGGPALPRAVFAYNHAQWYVDEVLALAARYR